MVASDRGDVIVSDVSESSEAPEEEEYFEEDAAVEPFLNICPVGCGCTNMCGKMYVHN